MLFSFLSFIRNARRWRVTQPLIWGAAELLSLKSLTFEGGTTSAGLDLHVLTGEWVLRFNRQADDPIEWIFYTRLTARYKKPKAQFIGQFLPAIKHHELSSTKQHTPTRTGLKALTELRVRPHCGLGLSDQDLVESAVGEAWA